MTCGHPWSVCGVVLVPYVDAGTVMRVLLFVLDVWMLREGDGNGCMGNGEGVFGISAEHECVGGTRASGIVSDVW